MIDRYPRVGWAGGLGRWNFQLIRGEDGEGVEVMAVGVGGGCDRGGRDGGQQGVEMVEQWIEVAKGLR